MSDRSFRDPVHGFIRLSDAECELLDTTPLRRLRNIHQLALSNLVYHGAEHSRFGHTLGVMHLASRFLHSVQQKRGGLNWPPEDFARRLQLLRLGALCHDIGHSPFSHAGEEGKLLSGKHEQYSAAIVRATAGHAGEVRQVIEARGDDFHGVTAEDVADLIEGQAVGRDAFLFGILSGELDCDRSDYLQRDSIYCGVQYGRFDSERLVSTLTWTEESGGNPILALEEDGLHAAEGLLLARYFMFTQVYFHRVRRAYDHHLSAA
jgi:HD superfamily phosphohydrolase